MNAHADTEALSAYLDGEVDPSERVQIESHLEDCSECSQRFRALEAASAAIASLEPLTPTVDESRALRRILWESRPTRRMSTGMAAIAGAGALAATILALVVFVQFQNRQAETTGDQGSALQQEESRSLVFTSEREVREAMTTDPGLAGAEGRWTFADVGARQEEEIGKLTGDPGRLDAEADQALDAEAQSSRGLDQSGAPKSARDCVEGALAAQPYPMMPLLVREAWFKDTSAWLLVFAYSPDAEEDDDPLDRIQVQLVRRNDCTQLHYWSYRP